MAHRQAPGARTVPRAARTPARARSAAGAVAAGILLEAVPMGVGAILGRPLDVALTGLGFVLAWATVAGAPRRDGVLDLARGLRSLPRLAGRLLALYAVVVAVGVTAIVTTAIAVGIVVHDVLAGALVLAFAITLLARFAYAVPCLAGGDDLIVGLERAWVLTGAGGLRALAAICALAVAALGPPVVVAELSAPLPAPAAFVATLATLAVTGPILMFGLERMRPSLEAAARDADPAYGRA